MGQVSSITTRRSQQALTNFQDLRFLPPEIAITVLSNLNATDLCMAACVWKDLGYDDLLWKIQCHSRWNYVSIYQDMEHRQRPLPQAMSRDEFSYSDLYLALDDATLLFHFDPQKALNALFDSGIMKNTPLEIAKLLNGTTAIHHSSVEAFLLQRRDVLSDLVKLQDFSGLFLPDGLRRYFKKIHPPNERGEYLELLVEQFSERYVQCNGLCRFNKETVSVLCYSLILLSVDLYSPNVKNKMSKREFIKNNKQILPEVTLDYLGDLYDDIYLNGHIASSGMKVSSKANHQCQRPYGMLFELRSWSQTCC